MVDRWMQPSLYISVMLVPAGGEIPVDLGNLAGMGINYVVCFLLFMHIMAPWKKFPMNVHALICSTGCLELGKVWIS